MQAGAAERVRAQIEESILSGELPAGARVVADEYARQMGVSHIPVREALHALAADGWIVHRRHQGAFVRDYDPTALADLFEARTHLEATVAALAAQRRTTSQLAELEQIVTRQAAIDDSGELARINAAFHVALAGCSHNSILTSYVRDLTKQVRFYFLPAARTRRSHSLSEHEQIIDAIRRRDGERARQLVLAHITDTSDTLRALTPDTAQDHRAHFGVEVPASG
jgi:DNA-binding GntR family transcriptional regulator